MYISIHVFVCTQKLNCQFEQREVDKFCSIRISQPRRTSNVFVKPTLKPVYVLNCLGHVQSACAVTADVTLLEVNK